MMEKNIILIIVFLILDSSTGANVEHKSPSPPSIRPEHIFPLLSRIHFPQSLHRQLSQMEDDKKEQLNIENITDSAMENVTETVLPIGQSNQGEYTPVGPVLSYGPRPYPFLEEPMDHGWKTEQELMWINFYRARPPQTGIVEPGGGLYSATGAQGYGTPPAPAPAPAPVYGRPYTSNVQQGGAQPYRVISQTGGPRPPSVVPPGTYPTKPGQYGQALPYQSGPPTPGGYAGQIPPSRPGPVGPTDPMAGYPAQGSYGAVGEPMYQGASASAVGYPAQGGSSQQYQGQPLYGGTQAPPTGYGRGPPTVGQSVNISNLGVDYEEEEDQKTEGADQGGLSGMVRKQALAGQSYPGQPMPPPSPMGYQGPFGSPVVAGPYGTAELTPPVGSYQGPPPPSPYPTPAPPPIPPPPSPYPTPAPPPPSPYPAPNPYPPPVPAPVPLPPYPAQPTSTIGPYPPPPAIASYPAPVPPPPAPSPYPPAPAPPPSEPYPVPAPPVQSPYQPSPPEQPAYPGAPVRPAYLYCCPQGGQGTF